MDSQAVKTTANAFVTAGYYFSPRFFAEKWKKTAERISVILGSYAPNLIGEVSTWVAIGTIAGRQGILERNAASAGIALATVVGNLGWLAYGKRKERQSQIEK